MEIVELFLVLVTAVLLSALLDRVLPHVAAPLVQVAIGLVMALALSMSPVIEANTDLFMMLFIAPLLFYESKELDKAALWKDKGTVLCLAIGPNLYTHFASLRSGVRSPYAPPSFGQVSRLSAGLFVDLTNIVTYILPTKRCGRPSDFGPKTASEALPCLWKTRPLSPWRLWKTLGREHWCRRGAANIPCCYRSGVTMYLLIISNNLL